MRINRTRALASVQDQLHAVGPAPSSVPYYEPFTESLRSVEDADKSPILRIDCRGQTVELDLMVLSADIRELCRRCILWAVGRLAPTTVLGLYAGLEKTCRSLGPEVLLAPFDLNAMELKTYWHDAVLPWLVGASDAARPLKQYLHFSCDLEFGCLREGHKNFVRSFQGPPGNLYVSLESGDVFLTPSEEAQIVRFLDDLAFSVAQRERTETETLREACVLACAYEHAMRPIQIAKVLEDDVRIRFSPGFQNGMTVHIRFHMEKQKSSASKLPMLRRVKPEWAPIFGEYDTRRVTEKGNCLDAHAESYFGMGPATVSYRILRTSKSILGHTRSATDYRHTAAQRLVDAGASHEELATFLGHRSQRTSNVYYEDSADSVERLNKGLALSPVYTRIENLYRNKSIDPAELAERPADNQIAGAPHAVPIAGIGECVSGQSMCPKNPVLSCYGCVKFIPVRDATKHRQVRDTLRPVVRRFFEESEGDTASPAYVQLRNTIAIVEEVIEQHHGG